MYKKQMSVQKILCILSVIASALVFVYSLGIMTDMYDMLYFLSGRDKTVDTSVFYNMQDTRVFEYEGVSYRTALSVAAGAPASVTPDSFTKSSTVSRVATAKDAEGKPVLILVDKAQANADLTALEGIDPATLAEAAPEEGTAAAAKLTTRSIPGFVHKLELAGIGLILISCLLFVTNTHLRRKYYISNFIATFLVLVANAAVAVWAHMNILVYRGQFLDLDFETIRNWLEKNKYGDLFTESTFWFDIHYAVFGFALVISVLLIVNVIWKCSLMSKERALLASGARGNTEVSA